MDFLTQLVEWLAASEAWLDAEPWRRVAVGAFGAAFWGAGIFLIWRRSVETRARELAPRTRGREREDHPLFRFEAKVDDRASAALRKACEDCGGAGRRVGAVHPPAHPNCRSKTPQADELEARLGDLREAWRRQRQAERDGPQTFEARSGKRRAPPKPDNGGPLSKDPDENWDGPEGVHEQGETSVPARPILRPALEGVDIHERMKRERAKMVEACESIGVSANRASEAMAFLGRALQGTASSVEVEPEVQALYEPGSPTPHRPPGRVKYTVMIRGFDRTAVLTFADVQELHWFAAVFRSARTQGVASNIEIGWAWTTFRSLHNGHPGFGLPGWKGGVAVERRPAPEVVRFRCGTYMMAEWGLTSDSGGSPAPDHGGKCPACADLKGGAWTPPPVYASDTQAIIKSDARYS